MTAIPDARLRPQIPPTRRFDYLVIVAVMLVTALLLCWLKRRDIGRSADGWFIAIAAELVLVIGVITDLLKHLHSP